MKTVLVWSIAHSLEFFAPGYVCVCLFCNASVCGDVLEPVLYCFTGKVIESVIRL